MRKDSWMTIDEYIATFPDATREKLSEIRAAIRKAAPLATETISYRMPAFEQVGILVYFAAFSRHIGFYPTASGIAVFREEIAAYKSSKGAVRFPLDEPLPIELIERIVRFRVKENTVRGRKNNRRKS
jgi:uncharacterized protein YdhG (YjbR/CyaY superfamily)